MDLSSHQNFSIYRASAGSGKTYILTLNYLKLALQHPSYFKSILAVTFTNKATAEMKYRILDTLKQLTQEDHPMATDLQQALHIEKEQLQKRASKLLKTILHNYSFFSVTTIDAFFQKIVYSFAREIGIHTGYKIELDTRKVLSKVVDKMLAEMGHNKQMVQWLTRFAIVKIQDGASWDTREAIKNLSSELQREFVVLNKKEIFDPQKDGNFMVTLVANIYAQIQSIKKGMHEIGWRVKKILNQHDLSQQDFAYKSSGVGGYMSKIIEGQMAEYGTRVTAAVHDHKWYSKSSKTKNKVEKALEMGLGDLIEEATNYFDTHHTEYFSLLAIVKYIYTYGLLSKIAEEINNYREDNGVLLISDFPVFLHHIINQSDTPYIYEKVGTRYKHYLIDEFQDTSQLQWLNFKPLVKDALNAGHFSMVVGDIKQSIYRWRGGNWKILLHQIETDIGEAYIQKETLDTNRRSKQNIVAFNNHFFDVASHLLESKLANDQEVPIPTDSLHITKAYTASTQKSSNQSKEGLIDIQFIPKNQKPDHDDLIMERLISNIQQLQTAKYQLKDIAILVRNNKQATAISDALMAHTLRANNDGFRYEVISNESLYVKRNPAVHLILQAVFYVWQPQEALHLVQLEYAYDSYCKRIDTQYQNQKTISQYVAPFTYLKSLNLEQLIDYTISYFQLYQHHADHAYLMAFQDTIRDYLAYEPNTLSDFMAWWKDHDNRSIQVSEDQDAIRMMTIHKAKGLQFKAVIVPYCNWQFDHAMEQRLWCDTREQPLLTQMPFLPVRYSKKLKLTTFFEAFIHEKTDIYLDNFNLLYVALTRAEHALYITCPMGGSGYRVNELLYQYAKQQSYLLDNKNHHIQIGQLLSYSRKEETNKTQQFTLENIKFSYQSNTNLLNDIPTIQEQPQIASKHYNKVIHWIYTSIFTKNDLKKAIKNATIKYELKAEVIEQIKLQVQKIWEIPKVASWFDPKWQVKNKSTIILDNGQTKRPDRVIVNDNKAIVIDYKTGAKSEQHLRQIKHYQQILTQMGYQAVEGYLIYINDSTLTKV